MAKDILPPIPPGQQKPASKKKGLFGGLFGGKKEKAPEPVAQPEPLSKPAQSPAVPEDINLDDIRKQLGLDLNASPAREDIDTSRIFAEDQNVYKEEDSGIEKALFELPDLEEPPEIKPRKDALLEDELMIEEPPRIGSKDKKADGKKPSAPLPSPPVPPPMPEPAKKFSLDSDMMDWTSDVKHEHETSEPSSDFTQEVKPAVELKPMPPKEEFVKEVRPEEVKKLAKDIKKKEFESKHGDKQQIHTEAVQDDIIVDESPEEAIGALKAKLFGKDKKGKLEEDKYEPAPKPVVEQKPTQESPYDADELPDIDKISDLDKAVDVPMPAEDEKLTEIAKLLDIDKLDKEEEPLEPAPIPIQKKAPDAKKPAPAEEKKKEKKKEKEKQPALDQEPGFVEKTAADMEMALNERIAVKLKEDELVSLEKELEKEKQSIEEGRQEFELEKQDLEKGKQALEQEKKDLEKGRQELAKQKKALEKEQQGLEKERKEFEEGIGELEKIQNSIDKEKLDLEKKKQDFEKDKIAIAGQASKYDFREKQMKKREAQLESEIEEFKKQKEEFTKSKEEARYMMEKLPVMRDDYEKLNTRMNEIYAKIKEYSRREKELLEIEDKIEQNKEALTEAQKRLLQAEEHIKEKGFSDYLETELEGGHIVSPPFTAKDLIKESHLEIYNMIDDCKALVRDKKIAEAKKVYMELRDVYSNIKLTGSEKDLLYATIRELYDDIKLAEMENPGADDAI